VTIAGLHQQISDLTAAVAARDAFISIAAHELRNPMTPIRGQVELLRARVRQGRSAPEQIEAGLERIEWLIDQYMRRATTLLDVSRITAGKLRLIPEPIRLAPLLANLVAGVAPLATRTGSAVHLSIPADLTGHWDRLAMEQIVDNLLSNAIKYGGGRAIDLTAETAGNAAVITVRDGGSGISEADRGRIFERFERAVGSGDHAGGFGMGLWIVRQLSEAMGGSVSVQSPEGGGTLFAVTLPLTPPA